METADKQSAKKELLMHGISGLLDKAKVPMRLHLKVVEALDKAVANHSSDQKRFEQATGRILTDLQNYLGKAKSVNDVHLAEIERLKTITHLKGDQGDPGNDGVDGVAPTLEEVVAAVKPYLPKPKDGEPGTPGKDAKIEDVVKEVIKLLQRGDVLHIDHVRGATGFLRDGVKYRFEELMHGGGSGGSTSTAVYGEVVAGSTNTFTLANTPTVGSVRVYALGQRLVLATDYTIAGAVITTVSSWLAGQIVADYNY